MAKDHAKNGKLQPKRKRGRPTLYTEEIAAEVCLRMASGETLSAICKDDHLPAESTIRLWDTEDREGFSARYAHARNRMLDAWADQIVDIADTENADDVQRARLRVDVRKWLLSKLRPAEYGPPPPLSLNIDASTKIATIAQLMQQAELDLKEQKRLEEGGE